MGKEKAPENRGLVKHPQRVRKGHMVYGSKADLQNLAVGTDGRKRDVAISRIEMDQPDVPLI